MNKKQKIIFAVILILVLICAFLILQVYSLNKDVGDLNSKLENSTQNLDVAQKKLQDSKSLFDEYQLELQNSINWFKDNSNINNFPELKKALEYPNCFKIENENCYIKLSCPDLINTINFGLEYRVTNTFQTLGEFIKNEFGDCKSYSMLYKAEMNYMVESCKNLGAKNIIVEAYRFGSDAFDNYYFTFETIDAQEYYMRNTKKEILKQSYIYPNVVCGYLDDPNQNGTAGHCVLAITKKKIENITDLNELNLAPIIEPQGGYYLGLINDVSSGFYLLQENYEVLPDKYISFIITDKDTFLFDDNLKSWLSYSYFNNKLEEMRKSITQ